MRSWPWVRHWDRCMREIAAFKLPQWKYQIAWCAEAVDTLTTPISTGLTQGLRRLVLVARLMMLPSLIASIRKRFQVADWHEAALKELKAQ